MKQRHDMKHMTHIATLTLSVLLALTACEHNRHTPEEDKVPLSFSALSQNTPTKADDDELKFPHSDFGVWGIARKTGNAQPYILWETAAMSPVNKVGNEYHPQNGAYWIRDYKYSFIAIAPWENWQSSTVSVNSTSSGSENVQFTYDMTAKYGTEGRDLDIDLMAAVGKNEVTGPVAEHDSQQGLTFHNLLTKICIAVEFIDATGVVTEMRLLNVNTKATYTIGFKTPTSNEIAIGYAPVNQVNNVAITRADLDENQQSQWTLHILPQDISGFELYLDFDIMDGNKVVSSTKNVRIPLTNAKSDPDYGRNERYNWTIKISTRAISFDVSVADWDSMDDLPFDLE